MPPSKLSYPKMSVLHREFSSMVVVDRHQKSLEQRRILEGDNPFKVWREHFCEKKDDVAEFMGIDVLDYIDIEEGEVSPDVDDILGFCRYFNLHPYDLMNEDTPEPYYIEALLTIYNQPSLLKGGDVDPKTLARETLIVEASESFEALADKVKSLRMTYPREHAITIDCLEQALRMDGRLSVDPRDIFDQFKKIQDETEGEIFLLNQKANRLAEDRNRHSKQYHLFGRYLFTDEWPNIHKRLFKALDNNPIDDVMASYLSPKFLGMRAFPELASPLWINGRSWTWQEAQREQWKYAETTYLAMKDGNKVRQRLDVLAMQADLFEEWVDGNFELLAQYDNRQRILLHEDFAHLRKEYVPYTPPKRKPDAKLAKLFGLKP